MSSILLARRRLPITSLLSRCLQARHYSILGKQAKNARDPHALPSTPARTRFAPSPTGYLHLGSIRTALYNYLLARATGGQFIIRLEDTDQTRFVEDAEEKLYDDLKWAGMDWDEGPDKGGKFGPYKQSERLDLYRKHAGLLLDNGRAYRCFCPPQPADPEAGWTNGYPGTCKHIPRAESDRRAAIGEPHVIRFDPSKEPIEYMDIVYGQRNTQSSDNGPVIIKSDGFPTYHFANVVDDHHMEITHVIRGAEWLISTPLHVDMYQALEWQPPSFGHVGLLVDQQRQKLSKRDRENIGVSVFRNSHILPQALMNFSVLLGWNQQLGKNAHLRKNGVMTMSDMHTNFSLKFTRGDIVVDLTKLKFFQTTWTRDLTTGKIDDPSALNDHILKPIISILERIETSIQPVDKFRMHRNKNEKPPELPEAERLFLEDLGINTADHHSFYLLRGKRMPLEAHLREILIASKGDVSSPEQFVRDYKYAFFPPSADALRKAAFDNLQGQLVNKVLYFKAKNPRAIADQTRKLDLISLLDVFHHQLRDFASEREKDWEPVAIAAKLAVLVDCMQVQTQSGEGDASVIWKFLRWVCLCAQPETMKLSLARLFYALGPEQTFKMFTRARRVARSVDRVRKSEVKKAYADRLQRETREKLEELRTRWGLKEAAAKQPLIRFLPNKSEEPTAENDSFSIMMRSTHRQGPFVSTVPGAATVAGSEVAWDQRNSSADVDLRPQMLEGPEWKSGERRLDLDNENTSAVLFNGDLPLGHIPAALSEDELTDDKSEELQWFDAKRKKAGDNHKEAAAAASPSNSMGGLAPAGAGRRNYILKGAYAGRKMAEVEMKGGKKTLALAGAPIGIPGPFAINSSGHKDASLDGPSATVDGVVGDKVEKVGEGDMGWNILHAILNPESKPTAEKQTGKKPIEDSEKEATAENQTGEEPGDESLGTKI